MKISIFSNYLNAHQLPLALAFDAMPDVDFTCVSLTAGGGNAGRKNLDHDYSFVIRAYDGEAESAEAMRHATEDDIVVFQHMDGHEEYVRARAATGRPFFRATERLLKRGGLWAYMPPKRWRTYDRFGRYRKADMQVLCASAYAAEDLSRFGFPVGRCLKWGYFPELPAPGDKANTCAADMVRMLSVQRLIDWKRVDLQIEAAQILRDRGCGFRLSIVGDGDRTDALRRAIVDGGLDDCVELVGGLPRAEALQMMRDADIFLATSNRKEGWGAAVNEAMAAGCAVVASDQMGSVPYLIRDGVDGVVFASGDALSLTDAIEALIDDSEMRLRVGRNASERVTADWSASCAAERLVAYSKALLAGRRQQYADGPMSPAGFCMDGGNAK